MNKIQLAAVMAVLFCTASIAQNNFSDNNFKGGFSLGTRNTISAFNHDKATGIGIGGQFRIQFSKLLNTEWYLDYITSKTEFTYKNDYHIGWSILLYPKNNYSFNKLLQPYLIAGHCFDLSKFYEIKNLSNNASRLSMATQAGIGTHINITSQLDCSLSGQYMLHFGKDIETTITGKEVAFTKQDFSTPDGHLLFTISFNYKFLKLWGNKR